MESCDQDDPYQGAIVTCALVRQTIDIGRAREAHIRRKGTERAAYAGVIEGRTDRWQGHTSADPRSSLAAAPLPEGGQALSILPLPGGLKPGLSEYRRPQRLATAIPRLGITV